MVVDTSALSAILFGEPEGQSFIKALSGPERVFMSAFTRLEASIVVEARKGEADARALAELISAGGIDTVPFDAGQAELALV